jgi:hypothetical protein
VTDRPTGHAPAGPEERAALRRALVQITVLVAALDGLGAVVGVLVAGAAGVWGALLGAGLGLLFCGATVVAMLVAGRLPPASMMGVTMGIWLVKVVVLLVVVAVLDKQSFYSAQVLVAVLLLVLLGSLVIDVRAVLRGRVPYVAERPNGGPR